VCSPPNNKSCMPTFPSPLNHPATPPISAVASHRRSAKNMQSRFYCTISCLVPRYLPDLQRLARLVFLISFVVGSWFVGGWVWCGKDQGLNGLMNSKSPTD
jgi:hypothetical protein